MTSRLKSAILRHTNSIKHTSFGGLKDTVRSHIPNTTNDASYMSNEYIHSSFFDDENYLSIIKCLDGGHEIAKDSLEYMQDYNELLQEHSDNLNSYSKKWKSKIKQQSSISSYHTTKLAQRETVSAPKRFAEVLQNQYDAILKVTTTYRTQIERMYPNERLGTTHKHHRTQAMDIYEKCRTLEKERLDLLGDTLIKFNEAAFSSNYLDEQDEIYENLMLKIKVERNSLEDLNFWAKTYHVYDSTTSLSSETNNNENISSQTTTQKTKKSHKNETENLTTKEENIQESVAEAQEEQSQADTTTSTKTKVKKNKNSSKTESTTTNSTASNQE
ncbi:unnamed protein product [Rotaria sp. Silwood2]|nr:unnamed protein product [Rotaria sp. Silwood2]